MFKVGDLVQARSTVPRLGTVVKGPYTHRFMDDEDYEMEAHGMGDYAGVYADAYDICITADPFMEGQNSQVGTIHRARGTLGWKLLK